MSRVWFISLMLLILAGCEEQPGPEGPNCNDGIQNGNETGVDCGGDCFNDCFTCLSDFCSMLSGALSSDPTSKITWFTDSGLYNIPEEWEFHNSGVFYRKYIWSESDVDDFNGLWEFDNAEAPERINLEFLYVDPEHPRQNPTPYIILHKLTQDSLIYGSNNVSFKLTPKD